MAYQEVNVVSLCMAYHADNPPGKSYLKGKNSLMVFIILFACVASNSIHANGIKGELNDRA